MSEYFFVTESIGWKYNDQGRESLRIYSIKWKN
jgi:hypothetical protein